MAGSLSTQLPCKFIYSSTITFHFENNTMLVPIVLCNRFVSNLTKILVLIIMPAMAEVISSASWKSGLFLCSLLSLKKGNYILWKLQWLYFKIMRTPVSQPSITNCNIMAISLPNHPNTIFRYRRSSSRRKWSPILYGSFQ